MPFYRSDGSVGGFWSFQDMWNYKVVSLFLYVLLFAAAGFGIASLFSMVDWESVAQTTAIVLAFLAAGAVSGYLLYRVAYGAVQLFRFFGVRRLLYFMYDLAFSVVMSLAVVWAFRFANGELNADGFGKAIPGIMLLFGVVALILQFVEGRGVSTLLFAGLTVALGFVSLLLLGNGSYSNLIFYAIPSVFFSAIMVRNRAVDYEAEDALEERRNSQAASAE